MKRKVIQLAGKTLLVSLPSKWARKYNVHKGDEVHVNEQDNSLVIQTQKARSHEKTTVSIAGLNPMVKRVLGALYKVGYDEIKVQFSPDELLTAQEVIREEFIGFEVVYSGKSTLTVKKISSIDPAEFDTVMRRLFLIIQQMGQDSIEAVQKQDEPWLKSIAFMDKDVDKYDDFCRRVLNKYGYKKFRATPPMYYIIEQLERIGDSYRDICNYQLAHHISLSKETLGLYKSINDFYTQFYTIFYTFDLKELTEFGKRRYELVDAFKKRFESCDKKESMILLYLYTLLDNIFDMNGALMAVKL